jgi:hypothetical protein
MVETACKEKHSSLACYSINGHYFTKPQEPNILNFYDVEFSTSGSRLYLFLIGLSLLERKEHSSLAC